MSNIRQVAHVLEDPIDHGRHRGRYVVACCCGRINTFHRWSWILVGAVRCRGCWDYILCPSAPLPFEVLDKSWFPATWPGLDFFTRSAVVALALASWLEYLQEVSADDVLALTI